MQASIIFSFLLLLASSAAGAQVPPPPAATNVVAPATPTNAQTDVRRRFQRRAATATNVAPRFPAPSGTNPAVAPAAVPSFPPPPSAPATTASATNVPGAPPTFQNNENPSAIPSTATVLPAAQPVVVEPSTNITVNQAETVVIPQPQVAAPATAAQPVVVDPNATARPGTPIPAVPTQVTTGAGVPPPGTPTTLPPNTVALPGENQMPVASSPLVPGLSPTERIEAGQIALQNMPLEQFFEVYSLYSGRTILRPLTLQNVQLTLKAQTDLTRLEVVQAMDSLLALNQIVMIPMGEKFVKAVPAAQADKEGAEISQATAAELPHSEQFVTRIVKLKTAKPSEIAPTLTTFSKAATAVTPIDSNQTLILRDYSSNVKRMLEIIEQIDVMPEMDFTLEVIPIKYGKVSDIYATMSGLIYGSAGGGAATGGFTGATAGGGAFGGGAFGRGGAGGVRSSGFGSGRTGVGSSGMRGGMGGSYGGGNYGGGGSYYPMEQLDDQNIFPQQVAQPGVGAAAGQADFRNRLNNIISRAANPQEIQVLENARIVPDDRSNRLLIFANKRDMAMITNIVTKVDVLLAQVLIEAIILEVKLGDSLNLGISSVQHPKQFGKDFTGAGAINNGQPLFSTITNFPSGTPEGFTYLSKIGDDFEVAITAVAKDNQINILSRPRIQTSHAIPGFFFIGETVPYITGISDYGGLVGSGVSTRSSIQERTIGLQLDVTPFITPEGMVVMEISQNFDQRGGEVLIDGNPVPLVNSRQAQAMLTVRDGDIIMLGGFISDNRSKSHSGVPFLKDIPGLGALFRSKSDKNDRTELIILMKATVLESPEAAALLADRERLQLPGVRQAEAEFTEAEGKRMRKVEKKLKK